MALPNRLGIQPRHARRLCGIVINVYERLADAYACESDSYKRRHNTKPLAAGVAADVGRAS